MVATFTIYHNKSNEQAQRIVLEQQNRHNREQIERLQQKVDKLSNKVEESSKKSYECY